ncbi:phage portal protein [bacterium]|nr:phage portal protein [bacterium]
MWDYFRDKWRTARLKARYQRLVQEQVLELIEERASQTLSEEPGQWSLLGGGKSTVDALERGEIRQQSRQLVQTNPYARNILRLLEVYVTGPGLRVSAMPVHPDHADVELLRKCDRLWKEFLRHNRRHFTFSETARRTWRDGECFVRLFSQAEWPPSVRYVDPEMIAASTEHPDSEGLITEPQDIESIVAYLHKDTSTGELLEAIPAEEMLHLKINADSNERRGVSIFASILDSLAYFEKWLDTELQARKLQSSIVLWRKVQGGPSQVTATAEAAASSNSTDPYGSVRRERYRPGTILTTSHSTDLQFLQPNTNFGDAVPLGRLVLLGIAAGAGVPEFMLSSDASNSNYSSTMVAEGPAVKLFESEQYFFARELEPLWEWVLQEAAAFGLLPTDVLDQVTPHWTFPQLVNRDRAKERQVDAQLVKAEILSRAEVARRDNVDPHVMAAEIAQEAATDAD